MLFSFVTFVTVLNYQSSEGRSRCYNVFIVIFKTVGEQHGGLLLSGGTVLRLHHEKLMRLCFLSAGRVGGVNTIVQDRRNGAFSI